MGPLLTQGIAPLAGDASRYNLGSVGSRPADPGTPSATNPTAPSGASVIAIPRPFAFRFGPSLAIERQPCEAQKRWLVEHPSERAERVGKVRCVVSS